MGLASSNRTVLHTASGITASENGSAVKLKFSRPNPRSLVYRIEGLVLNSGSGTLDVAIQHRPSENVEWAELISFTQQSATSSLAIEAHVPLATTHWFNSQRVVVTIGSSPNFTFDVVAYSD